MKLTLKITLIVTIILFYSCVNKKKENVETKDVLKTKEVENHEGTGVVLSLNDGELWKANKETTIGVQNMISLMNDFKETNNIESYLKLTENLKEEFTMIFQKCTMKGEAHNQLHNFLIPINELFDGLSSKDLTTCKESFIKMNTQLSIYKNFFE